MSKLPPPRIQTNSIQSPLTTVVLVAFSIIVWSCQSKIGSTYDHPSRPNILFIAVDDLRPELSCYGVDYIQSPNIDDLAADGILFKNHYVQVPTCGASRYALLTGMYPRHINHLSNQVIVDSLANQPERSKPESFIHHLKRNGYYTVGMGKISHMPDGFVYGYQEPVSTIREMPFSWDEFHFDAGKWGTGHNAFFGYAGWQ